MCTADTTIKEWQCWCRLCAKHDGNYFDIFAEQAPMTMGLSKKLSLVIEEYFHIKIRPKDGQPLQLCSECCAMLASLQKYAEHVKKVQQMYDDLNKTTDTHEVDFKELFHKYRLFEWESFKPFLRYRMEKSTTTSMIEQKFSADAQVRYEELEKAETKWQATEVKVELPETVECDIQDVGVSTQMNEVFIVNGQFTEVRDKEIKKSEEKEFEKGHEINVELSDTGECYIQDVMEANQTNKILIADAVTVVRDEETETKELELTTEIKVELPTIVECDIKDVGEYEDSVTSSSDSQDFEVQLRSKRMRKISKNSTSRNGKEGNYFCNICSQRFILSFYFARHMKRWHGMEVTVPAVWNCTHCDESFKFKKDLKCHIGRVHAPKNYPCPHCDRKFKRAKVAENHIKSRHEGVGSFVCRVCGECLRSEQKAIEHMTIHKDRSAYECKCNYCGRRFKSTENLKTHLTTHYGNKPYSCNVCNKTFSNSSNCRSHKRNLHPKEFVEQGVGGVKVITQAPADVEKVKDDVSKRPKLITQKRT